MENTFVKWTDLPAGPVWLTPPDLSPGQTRALAAVRARVGDSPEMIWALSSGTSSVNQIKVLGLTRAAVLASAAAVNAHLRATDADRWLIAIPTYHVGGFAIAARAHLAGAGVDVLPRWEAGEFTRACATFGTTLCSLVPTQIFDLVAGRWTAPPRLRAIVVGGGALDPSVYRAARALGWPVLPSYGLTETASQVATAALDADATAFPDLKILAHAQIELTPDGRIRARGPSLSHVRAVATEDGAVTVDDPREDGWLVTEDLGELHDGCLRVLGRRDDVVKCLGVLVSIPGVEAELRDHARADGAEAERLIVLAIPDARRGVDLIAVTDQTSSLETLARVIHAYNAVASGPRRIARWAWVPHIPRTALGKVRRGVLRRGLEAPGSDSTAFI